MIHGKEGKKLQGIYEKKRNKGIESLSQTQIF